jgi:RHS repeat-associated protein
MLCLVHFSFGQTTQPLFTTVTFDTKTIDQSKEIGVVAGSASVSGGSANYSIPISLPPGTNGIVPKIGLAYQSSGGNSALGQGWSLSGLSTISRTSSSIYFDGNVAGVKMINEDKLVLDGMRLILKTGTGAAGSTYVTESESFSKISALSASSGMPDKFEVITKDGVIMEYGYTTDSRFMSDVPNSTAVFSWSINKIKYADGNYIEFKYLNDLRDFRIDQILYTGNSNIPQLPYNKIKFKYDARSDVNTVFENGVSIVSLCRMSSIDISAEGDVKVSRYSFKYGEDISSKKSFLNEITLFSSSDGVTYNASLNSTIFKYGDVPNSFETVTDVGTPFAAEYEYSAGDFNGDGISDVLGWHTFMTAGVKYVDRFKVFFRTNTGGWTAGLNQSLSTQSTKFNDWGARKSYNFLTDDYSGDGIDDVVVPLVQPVSGTNYFQLINIKTFDNIANNGNTGITITPIAGGSDRISNLGKYLFPGDFNGDGISDLICLLASSSFPNSPSAFIWYGGSSATTFTQLSAYLPTILNSTVGTYVVDFNGDGKSDIMTLNNVGTNTTTSFYDITANSINPIVTSLANIFPKDYLPFFGDFNGDRKTDVLFRTDKYSNSSAWKIGFLTGLSVIKQNFTFFKTPTFNQDYSGDRIFVSDFNGDGKADITHWYSVGSTQTSNTTQSDLYYNSQFLVATGIFECNIEHNSFTYPFNPGIQYTAYDLNGDGRSDLPVGNFSQILCFKKNGKEQLVEKIKNGQDLTTTFGYARMTESLEVYTKNGSGTFPLNNIQLPIDLATYQQEIVGGYINVTDYRYEEAKLYKLGKGLLGFKKIIAENSNLGITTVEEYQFNTTFFVPTLLKSSIFRFSDNLLMSESNFTYEFVDKTNKQFWLKPTGSTQTNVFESRTASSVNNTFDANGNVTKTTTINNGLETTVVEYTGFGVVNTPTCSKPLSISVSNTRGTQPVFSTSTTFIYNAIGQLTQKNDFQATSKNVKTEFLYNTTGNLTKTTITPSIMQIGAIPRFTTVVWDTKGRFPISTSNTLGQTSTATFDIKFGNKLTETGINTLPTTYTYDQFGKVKTVVSPSLPTNITTTHTYGWDINNTEQTTFFHKISDPTSPDVKMVYDQVGREKRTETETFGLNQLIFTKKTYDSRGNIYTSTAPYKTGETVLTTTNNFDTYNRISSTSNALATNNFSYAYNTANGQLTTTATLIATAGNQTSSKITDAAGKVISATDNGGTLTYNYLSNGKLKEVLNGATVLVTNEYNAVNAEQTKLIDINAGTTSYEYDGFGQLTKQTNAKNEVQTFKYNNLGQITERIGVEGTTTTLYNVDPLFPKILNLVKKIISFGTSNTQDFTYDDLGRTKQVIEYIEGDLNTTSYDYKDISGELKKVTYPSGTIINYEYDANGFLDKIKNFNNTVTLFTAGAMNGFEQYTSYSLGNGKTSNTTYNFGIPTQYTTTGVQNLSMTWDYQTGNLSQRKEIRGATTLTENFTYDPLNRLTGSTVGTNATLAITYSPSGNINTKTDAGNYTYSASKINALTSVTNPANNVSINTQDVTYTAFFQPATISENSKILTLTYGADYQRHKAILTTNSVVTNTRFYLGNYEKDISGAITKHIHYISAGDGLVAIVVRENNVDTYFYTYTDHLGSITAVTNSIGVIVAEQNFDAWGRNRNPSNWTYASVPAVPTWLYRGYTGHEHLSAFGLINMNGRLYDPLVGRMLSVDNFVHEDMAGLQGYNRYAYALNNPLKYADPSGQNPLVASIVGAVLGAYQGYQIANAKGYDAGDWQFYALIHGFSVLGSLSAAAGAAITQSGGFFANTLGIIASSGISSAGNVALSGGRAQFIVSFGAGSFNFSTGELGYLGKSGNSKLENIGYGFGALANLQDLVAWNQGTDLEVRSRKKLAGHSEANGDSGKIKISVGPNRSSTDLKPGKSGLKWESQYLRHSPLAENVSYIQDYQPHFSSNLHNINRRLLAQMTSNLDGGHNLLGFGTFRYGVGRGCVNYTARALLYAGVPTISAFVPLAIPVSLNLQLTIRQIGIYASPFFVKSNF